MKNIIENIRELSFYDTLRHGSIYMLSFFVIQLISLVSLPVFTSLLTPADFGVYEVFNNTVRIAGVLVMLNMTSGLYRYHFMKETDSHNVMRFVYSLALWLFLGFTLVYVLSGDLLLRFINIDVSLRWFFPVAVFVSINAALFDIYCVSREYSKKIAIWRIAYQVLKFVFAVSACWFLYRSFYGRILGELIAGVILVGFTIVFYLAKYITFRPRLNVKYEIVRYSASFIPVSLSGFILGYFDAIMINMYKGNNDAGLYSYAYKIAVIYSGVTASFITANRPKLFNLLNEGNTQAVKEQMRSVIKVIVAISCGFIFFAEDGGRLLALRPEFHASLYLMPVLILSYIFNDLNELYMFFFHYARKVRYFYISFFISALINIGLNMIFIPKYGYPAAAYTTLVSYFFMYVSTYAISKFLLRQSVPAITTYFDFFLLVGVIMGLNAYINGLDWNVWISLSVKMLIYGIMLLYLWRNMISRFTNKAS